MEDRGWSQHGCAVELACFLDFQDVTALVSATLGAGAVRELLFVTVGALGEADGRQRIVRAPLGGAGLGVAPLWICHYRFLSYTLPGRHVAHPRVAELLNFTRSRKI